MTFPSDDFTHFIGTFSNPIFRSNGAAFGLVKWLLLSLNEIFQKNIFRSNKVSFNLVKYLLRQLNIFYLSGKAFGSIDFIPKQLNIIISVEHPLVRSNIFWFHWSSVPIKHFPVWPGIFCFNAISPVQPNIICYNRTSFYFYGKPIINNRF